MNHEQRFDTNVSRRVFSAVLFTAVLLLISAPMLAVPRGGGPGQPSEDKPQMARMERVLNRLELTDAQRAQVEPILAGLKVEAKGARDRWIDARTALLQAIRRPAVDAAAVKGATARIAALELEGYLARAKAWSEIYPLLTERQAGRLDVFAAGPERRQGAWARERVADEIRHSFGRVFRRLELTEIQEEQIRAIFEERTAAIRELRRQDVAAHDELRGAIMRPTFAAAVVEAAAARHASAHHGLALYRAEIHAAVWSVLDDAQRGKLEEMEQHPPRRDR